jgi:hypothetical protein
VRLIHSAIRHFIGSGVWDEALGRPINQEDMAITLLTFSVSVLDGLRRFKIREAPEREEAYLHHWKVIGHPRPVRIAHPPLDACHVRRPR